MEAIPQEVLEEKGHFQHTCLAIHHDGPRALVTAPAGGQGAMGSKAVASFVTCVTLLWSGLAVAEFSPAPSTDYLFTAKELKKWAKPLSASKFVQEVNWLQDEIGEKGKNLDSRLFSRDGNGNNRERALRILKNLPHVHDDRDRAYSDIGQHAYDASDAKYEGITLLMSAGLIPDPVQELKDISHDFAQLEKSELPLYAREETTRALRLQYNKIMEQRLALAYLEKGKIDWKNFGNSINLVKSQGEAIEAVFDAATSDVPAIPGIGGLKPAAEIASAVSALGKGIKVQLKLGKLLKDVGDYSFYMARKGAGLIEEVSWFDPETGEEKKLPMPVIGANDQRIKGILDSAPSVFEALKNESTRLVAQREGFEQLVRDMSSTLVKSIGKGEREKEELRVLRKKYTAAAANGNLKQASEILIEIDKLRDRAILLRQNNNRTLANIRSVEEQLGEKYKRDKLTRDAFKAQAEANEVLTSIIGISGEYTGSTTIVRHETREPSKPDVVSGDKAKRFSRRERIEVSRDIYGSNRLATWSNRFDRLWKRQRRSKPRQKISSGVRRQLPNHITGAAVTGAADVLLNESQRLRHEFDSLRGRTRAPLKSLKNFSRVLDRQIESMQNGIKIAVKAGRPDVAADYTRSVQGLRNTKQSVEKALSNLGRKSSPGLFASKPSPIPFVPSKKQIGGVEFGYAKDALIDKRVAGVKIDQRTGGITFIGQDGTEYRLRGNIRSDILNALLFLKAKYGDVTRLAFTLDINQDEQERASRDIEAYIKGHREEIRAQARQLALRSNPHSFQRFKVDGIRVANRPLYIGANYGDTIVGKIALDADVALKFLASGLYPKTGRRFDWTNEYWKAIRDEESGFSRMWLYLKALRMKVDGNEIDVEVDVGIKTKRIKYIDNERTVDIGETPESVQRIARILERDYDRISERVRSWKALKEVYRGLAVLQIIDALGANPEVRLDEAKIRVFDTPETVDGLVAYHLAHEGNGRFRQGTVVGGVNYALRNRLNQEENRSNNFFNELSKFASKNSSNPYPWAVMQFLKWDIDEVIKTTSVGLQNNRSNWKLLNLRANAYVTKAYALPKPSGVFEPAVLPALFNKDLRKRIEERKIDGLRARNATALTLALEDYDRARRINSFLPSRNRRLLNRLRGLPAEDMLRKALATNNEAEKIRLNSQAAALYMETGGYRKAAKRLEYLTYLRPKDIGFQARLTKAYMKDARSNLRVTADPPRVLLLPLRNASKRAKDAWLSRGLILLLGYASQVHGDMNIVPLPAIEYAKEVFGFEEDELYATGPATISVANMYDVRARYIVTGSYAKFGRSLKLNLTVFDKETKKQASIAVKGSLERANDLIKKVYDGILFEIAGKVARDARYDALPNSAADVEVWSKVREDYALGRYGEAVAFATQMAAGGNPEAVLSNAEILIDSGEYASALKLLKSRKIANGLAWRYEHLLGEAEFVLGRLDEARKHLETAARLNPRSVPSLRLLREIFVSSEARLRVNEELIALRRARPEIYMESAKLHLDKGRKVQALETLTRFLKNEEALSGAMLRDVEGLWAKASG